MSYILLLFGPVDGEVMNAESFPEVGDLLGDSVDDMGDFVAYYKLDILHKWRSTLAAISSPMNRPSLTLMGPGRNSKIDFLSCWWVGL